MQPLGRLNSSCKRKTFSKKVLPGNTVETRNGDSAKEAVYSSAIIERMGISLKGSRMERQLISNFTRLLIYGLIEGSTDLYSINSSTGSLSDSLTGGTTTLIWSVSPNFPS